MPKPRVKANSSSSDTVKRSIYDQAIASPNAGAQDDGRFDGLSFLSGGVDTNDLGSGSPWDSVSSMDDYMARSELRKHMVEQGLSTWVFDKE